MSARTPSFVPRSMVTDSEVGGRAGPDDLRGARRHLAAVAQVQQPPQALGLTRQGALPLDGDLEFANLPLERQVVGVDAAERGVVTPRPADAVHDGGRPALHLGEDAEDERLQHRHARPRVDLRGDQDDVAGRKRQEQLTAPPPDVGNSHGQDCVSCDRANLRSCELDDLANLRTGLGELDLADCEPAGPVRKIPVRKILESHDRKIP